MAWWRQGRERDNAKGDNQGTAQPVAKAKLKLVLLQPAARLIISSYYTGKKQHVNNTGADKQTGFHH